MSGQDRRTVTITVVAHEDTSTAELDRRASETWDRIYESSTHKARTKFPRWISGVPHSDMSRHLVHTYEGTMWD